MQFFSPQKVEQAPELLVSDQSNLQSDPVDSIYEPLKSWSETPEIHPRSHWKKPVLLLLGEKACSFI